MAGNITIVEAQDNFQKVSREVIRNRAVDLVTLAIYVKVLHFGKLWKLDIKGLAKAVGKSEQIVRRSINVLEHEGFVRRVAVRDEKTGQMHGWDYFVYSEPLPEDERTPISTALSKNRNTVEPICRSNRNAVKCKGNNIESTNKIDSNNKEDDMTVKSATRRFTKPTVAEIREYAASINYAIDAEYFFDYYERAGWKYGKQQNPVKDWKACVRLWKRQDDKKTATQSAVKEYTPKHNYYDTQNI